MQFYKANIHDVYTIDPSINKIRENITNHINLGADKGFRSKKERIEDLKKNNVDLHVPNKKNQKERTPEQTKLVLTKRFKVEHSIQRVKIFDRVNVRKDKYLQQYKSFVFLALIMIFRTTSNRYDLSLMSEEDIKEVEEKREQKRLAYKKKRDLKREENKKKKEQEKIEKEQKKAENKRIKNQLKNQANLENNRMEADINRVNENEQTISDPNNLTSNVIEISDESKNKKLTKKQLREELKKQIKQQKQKLKEKTKQINEKLKEQAKRDKKQIQDKNKLLRDENKELKRQIELMKQDAQTHKI